MLATGKSYIYGSKFCEEVGHCGAEIAEVDGEEPAMAKNERKSARRKRQGTQRKVGQTQERPPFVTGGPPRAVPVQVWFDLVSGLQPSAQFRAFPWGFAPGCHMLGLQPKKQELHLKESRSSCGG